MPKTRDFAIRRMKADLFVYPGKSASAKLQPGIINRMGDAHANPLRMLHFLIRCGTVAMPSEDYQMIVAIYLRHGELLKSLSDLIADSKSTDDANQQIDALKKQISDDFASYESILIRSTVNTEVLSRFLGDELSDRGANDWFVILLLRVLAKKEAKFTVNLSNHSRDFLQSWASADKHTDPKLQAECYRSDPRLLVAEEYRHSSLNLAKLIEWGVVIQAEITNFMQAVYIPASRLVSYAVVGNKVIVDMHAPGGLEVVTGLAKELYVSDEVRTSQDLTSTIDAINKAHQAFLHDQLERWLGSVWKQYELAKSDFSAFELTCIHVKQSHIRVIWNRFNIADRPAYAIDLGIDKVDYELHIVHGHTGESPVPGLSQEQQARFHSLDVQFGKSIEDRHGHYPIFVTDDNGPVLDEESEKEENRSFRETFLRVAARLSENSASHAEALQPADMLEEKHEGFLAAHRTMLIILSSIQEISFSQKLDQALKAFNQDPKDQKKFVELVQAIAIINPRALSEKDKKCFSELQEVVLHVAQRECDFILARRALAHETPVGVSKNEVPPITFSPFFKGVASSCAAEAEKKRARNSKPPAAPTLRAQ